MKKVLLFAIALMLISVTALRAQKNKDPENWNKIGETTLDFKTTKGVVSIVNVDNFKALRIKTDAPVHVDNIVVVYDTGDPANVPVRYDFKAGIESRSINLQDATRKIKEVDVMYRLVVNSKIDKATIGIWGTK
jgi:hypothetical protein